MNSRYSIILILTIFLMAAVSYAQVDRQTGIIRGVVKDIDGKPLQGVNVTAKGSALMGSVSDMSGINGAYRLVSLPPGTYSVTAELEGFIKIVRENVIVEVGSTFTVNFTLQQAAISEEITVTAPSPTVDIASSKISNVVSEDVIQMLPLDHSPTSIVALTPGAISETVIHGGVNNVLPYEIDGVNVNDPANYGLMVGPLYDTIEEVEVVSGGLPAQYGNTGGGFVNIVTKSGGNEFHGMVSFRYTNEHMTDVLYSDAQLADFGIAKPQSPIFQYNAGIALGGPIVKDRLWFFGNVNYNRSKSYGPFIPTTILGQDYGVYNTKYSGPRGFLKLTAFPKESIRFFVMLESYVENNSNYDAGWNVTEEATLNMKTSVVAATLNLDWTLGSNTILHLRGGYTSKTIDTLPKDKSYSGAAYQDIFTGYVWGTPYAERDRYWVKRPTLRASARITHFMDNFIWGDHEFGAGIEWERNKMERYWPTYGITMQWDYYNGNPYYYRGFYNLTGPHPTRGDGRLGFSNGGENRDAIWQCYNGERAGMYIQDVWSIKNRLTINLGLRVDYDRIFFPTFHLKERPGLAYEIGEAYVKPVLGWNPWAAYDIPALGNVVKFMNLSPRLGISYDPFGDGKTALKIAFSYYHEPVANGEVSTSSPTEQTAFKFDWWDLNNNGVPDSPGIDKYNPTGGYGQFKYPDLEALKARVDPNLEAPLYTEFIVSVHRQLFKDFSIQAQFLLKKQKGTLLSADYDPITSQYFYDLNDITSSWWVPFTTTVPAVDDFPASTIDMYFLSNDAPWSMRMARTFNYPGTYRKYSGLELIFNKRWSGRWSLGGSVVFSKMRILTTSGLNSPNDLINTWGVADVDRPLSLKLFGAFKLPLGFVTSFFFWGQSGSPYCRTITVVPPASWASNNNVRAVNYSVRLEPTGSRRLRNFVPNLDFRLEKEFRLPKGKIGAFVDVYNLLGDKYANKMLNPAGTWRPVDINTDQGTYILASNYGKVTSIDATRVVKLSIRYTF